MIHCILFQNALEIGFLFWIWSFCHNTLPIYAIVTQMGSKFKKTIIEEHVQVGILGLRTKVKWNKGMMSINGSSSTVTRTASMPTIGTPNEGSSLRIQLGKLPQKDIGEIQPSKD